MTAHALTSDDTTPDPAASGAGDLVVYSTTWCPFCRRLTHDLDRSGVPYREVDVDRDEAAARLVTELNRGNRVVPTVVFPDGSWLTNPPADEVTARLATPGLSRPVRFRPISPEALAEHLADVVAGSGEPPGRVRVLLDGAPATDVHALADAVAETLRRRGRSPLRVRAESFWRDASVRLEWGRHDEQSLFSDWLDASALRREVLDPLGPDGDGTWLPSLRDPVTNRSTRAAREDAPAGAVLLLSGALLLVHDLPSDVVVHVIASSAALARRTPPDQAWTLPVFARYDREVDPAARADVVVRAEDLRHPAIAG